MYVPSVFLKIKLYLIIPCLVYVILPVNCGFTNIYGKIPSYELNGNDDPIDPGTPLFLTPLIEQGKIKEAQEAAKTNFSGFKKLLSYSGYLTVNKQYNSNLFFWFFPAAKNYETAPVLLWLQGGPGATSLIGLFAENGPYQPKTKHGLKLRKYPWTTSHSVIYIDNPVGAGYSFTNGGYAQNETAVGQDLYNALLQFFQLFPQLQKNDFYVTGESYAGKYVPAISYTIHKNNENAKQKINLKGMSIGNGLCDPINQLKYGDYLYQIGLIDLNALKLVQNYEEQGKKLIQDKKYTDAAKLFDYLIDGDFNKTSLFKNITGFDNYFNYLVTSENSKIIADMGHYIQRADIRKAIHVGNTTFNGIAADVELYLLNDIMQSVAPWISELLNYYRVLIYNGQLDIIVAYPLTENFLQNLNFNAASEYKTAKRYQWHVDKDIAGYVKEAGNLTEILVRNAGHMVPADQPKWALDLISRFVRNKPFH